MVSRRSGAAYVLALTLFAIGSANVHASATSPVHAVLYQGIGRGLTIWVLFATGCAALWYALRPLRALRDLRTILVVQLFVGVCVAGAVWVFPSSDPIAYAYYGQIAAAGQNAWHPPTASESQADPDVTTAMRFLYGDPPVPSIYGPAFVAVEVVLARIPTFDRGVSLIFAQRVLMLAAWLGVTAFLPAARRSAWAFDPFLAFVFAADAHNDALMLLALAAALRCKNRVLSGALMVLGAGVKIVALAALGMRRNAALAATAILAVWVALAPQTWTLVPHVAQSSLLLVQPELPRGGAMWLAIVRLLLALMIGVAAFRFLPRRRDRATAVAIVLVAAIPIVHPWYVSWIALPAVWASATGRRALGICEVVGFALYAFDFM